MRVWIAPSAEVMSHAAADRAAAALRDVLARQPRVRLAAATAASQVSFQRAVVAAPGIDWTRVDLFQLDEYIGLEADHPARFSRLLDEHLAGPAGITSRYGLDDASNDGDVARICDALAEAPLDLAWLGIGENAHLAFNDPPADFVTTRPYLDVVLDTRCRQQQVNEGWFARLDDVPRRALTMSITQMMSARTIIVVVPGAHKAEAVHAALTSAISPDVPASILRAHADVDLFLDTSSAYGLRLTAYGLRLTVEQNIQTAEKSCSCLSREP
jgi:glucosamine-6-phosphate deaminase